MRRIADVHVWWAQAISLGTNCSRNCRNSARSLNNPRTTGIMGPQVQRHRNWGKDSIFRDQGNILPMFTTKVSRTSTPLLQSSHYRYTIYASRRRVLRILARTDVLQQEVVWCFYPRNI